VTTGADTQVCPYIELNCKPPQVVFLRP